MIDKARETALKILYRVDIEESYSNIALDEELRKNKDLNEKDIGLISEIIYGTTSWKLTIDEIIDKHSKIKMKKISPWILNILRMGVYQIVFLNKIPKSAAVNESVNLAKRYGHKSSSNFVNAILRKVDKADYEELFKIEEPTERISKTTSMPIWIVKELYKEMELEKVKDICENLNNRPSTSIRVNKLKITKEELKEELKEKRIEARDGIEEDFLILKNVKNIENMEEFKNGLFTVQDESAGMAARMLNAKQDETILDACSAPGGKTTYIAECMKNKGKIIAWDIHKHRTKLVKENAKRLGITIIQTEEKDATFFDEKYIDKFDKIILDVPCLGIGVIKRKPDIKWKRKNENIKEITEIQEKILQNCSRYLKEGGELIYSTCSILKEENQNIIDNFISKNKNFAIIENIKIYPNQEQDGFYICKLKKD